MLRKNYRWPIRVAWIVSSMAAAKVDGAEELLPVISKMQVMYSLVGHYSHIGERISFFNTYGSPQGNTNYVVPHLVYEPIVTLYNPHNTELRMNRSRIHLADPPVGFKFKKNNDYLRSEWATGDTFHGLARFQPNNDNNATARKSFTMVLTNSTVSGNPGGQIVLRPGESKSFGVWVEKNWTWGLETSGGYTSRFCFDWNANANLTNVDGRTNNQFGVEAIASPYVDFRAGFQTDGLSVMSGRPAATRYSFEAPPAGSNWVAIKTPDLVSVETKALRTVAPNPAIPDFQLSLLRGLTANVATDTARSYTFNAALLKQPGTAGVGGPAISRTFMAAHLIQSPGDSTPGGKTPFALFTIVAKSKALQRKAFQSSPQPSADELYETRLTELMDFSGAADLGPSDAPVSGIEVTGMQRVGDLLMLDLAAPAGTGHTWRVKGTDDLARGFTDNLTFSSMMEGPVGSGIYKVTVNVSGRGARYFVRIER